MSSKAHRFPSPAATAVATAPRGERERERERIRGVQARRETKSTEAARPRCAASYAVEGERMGDRSVRAEEVDSWRFRVFGL